MSAESDRPTLDNHLPLLTRVLICENQPEEAELLKILFLQQNCAVTLAEGPEFVSDAIAKLSVAQSNRVQYHLCVVDLALEGQRSGVELIRKIKAGFNKCIPIICSGNVHLIEECLPLGALTILVKPYNPTAIRDILRSHRLPTPD